MLIDTDGLNEVGPELERAMKYLKNSEDLLYSIVVPIDFQYLLALKFMPNEVNAINNKVKDIDSWVEECISNFSDAENETNGLLGGLLPSILAALPAFMDTTNGNNLNNTNSQKAEQNFKKLFSNIEDFISNVTGIDLENFTATNGEIAKETGSDILGNVMSFFSDLYDTGADIVGDISNFFQKDIPNAIQSAGAVLSDAWDGLYQNILQPIGGAIQTGVASIGNVAISAVKGLTGLGESLFDGLTILGTGVGTVFTGAWDGLSYLGSLMSGNTESWQSATASMWSNTMGFVAEDHVGNAFKSFYEDNFIGQWLDEHAHEWFKSDGPVTGLASGVTYVGGIVALSLLTFGIGGVITGTSAATSGTAFTGISALIAGMAGFGEGTETFWGQKRDSSLEGIKELYKNGEISEEEYNSIIAIKGMTDDQWLEIERDYRNGYITKEQFEAMQNIRKMPEDWKTAENLFSGLGYGVAIGTWEGIQWYLGGKLTGWSISGHQGFTSATRVAIDSIFNAGDTPFRAIIDSIANGKSFNEAFEEQGGLNSVLTNFGIGLIGSLGGEVFDIHNANKLTDRLNNLDVLNNLDSATSTKIRELLEIENKNGKININKMSDVELNKYVNDFIAIRNSQIDSVKEVLFHGGKNANLSEAVQEKLENGIDQINKTGLLNKFDEKTANRIRNILMEDYFSGRIDLINSSNSEITKHINDYIKQKNRVIGLFKEIFFAGKNTVIADQLLEKLEDAYDKIYISQILDNVDEKLADNLMLVAMEKYFANKITLNDIPIVMKEELKRNQLDDSIINNAKNIFKNLDDKFETVLKRTQIYGVDQGIFGKISIMNPKYYNELIDKFSNKYGMSKVTTIKMMEMLDSIGACSYGDICNGIVSEFIDKPQEFEKIFGFSIYNTTYGGFNSEELLFDMYVWMNSVENGGKLFKINENGEKEIIENAIKIDPKNNMEKFITQEYMTHDGMIDKYLKSKFEELSCTVDRGNFSLYSDDRIKNLIYKAVDEGKQVSICTFGTFEYIPVDGGIASTIDGGHITKVVDIVDDKLVVISWGKKYYLKLSDLENNNDCYYYIRDIKLNK